MDFDYSDLSDFDTDELHAVADVAEDNGDSEFFDAIVEEFERRGFEFY